MRKKRLVTKSDNKLWRSISNRVFEVFFILSFFFLFFKSRLTSHHYREKWVVFISTTLVASLRILYLFVGIFLSFFSPPISCRSQFYCSAYIFFCILAAILKDLALTDMIHLYFSKNRFMTNRTNENSVKRKIFSIM